MNTPYRSPAETIIPPPMDAPTPSDMLKGLAAVGVYKSMFLDLLKDNRSIYSEDRTESVTRLNTLKNKLSLIETDDLFLQDALKWFRFATFEDLNEACSVAQKALKDEPNLDHTFRWGLVIGFIGGGLIGSFIMYLAGYFFHG